MWILVDHTNGKNSGYFRIEKDGRRVADVFPYGVGVDAKWTKEQADLIVYTMNDAAGAKQ